MALKACKEMGNVQWSKCMTHRPRIETLHLGIGVAATRTRYPRDRVLDTHTHEGGALSIPFAGSFLEIFGKREFHIDTDCVLYKRPGFAHQNVVGDRGFDGVLVEISGERHRWIASHRASARWWASSSRVALFETPRRSRRRIVMAYNAAEDRSLVSSHREDNASASR